MSSGGLSDPNPSNSSVRSTDNGKGSKGKEVEAEIGRHSSTGKEVSSPNRARGVKEKEKGKEVKLPMIEKVTEGVSKAIVLYSATTKKQGASIITQNPITQNSENKDLVVHRELYTGRGALVRKGGVKRGGRTGMAGRGMGRKQSDEMEIEQNQCDTTRTKRKRASPKFPVEAITCLEGEEARLIDETGPSRKKRRDVNLALFNLGTNIISAAAAGEQSRRSP